MLRAPLRRNAAKTAVAQIKAMPAPFRGWNVRDRLEEMKPEYAAVCDNVIPQQGELHGRHGSAPHATGLPGEVESLMAYSGGVEKLFAASEGEIFDVTAAGAVGDALVTGLSGSRFQHTMFATTGGQFLVAVNGEDAPQYFNGSAWANVAVAFTGTLTNGSPDVTGVSTTDDLFVGMEVTSGTAGIPPSTTIASIVGTTVTLSANFGGSTTAGASLSAEFPVAAITNVDGADLIDVEAHQSRLWFVESGTMDAWYLPTLAITGAATKFPLGPLCADGGTLQAIGSWSRDASDAPSDQLVFVTSEGQALVYSGTDPASAETWALAGIFSIPKPLGRRCLVKDGGDLLVLTEAGVVSMSEVLAKRKLEEGISAVVQPAFMEAADGGRARFGWQLCLYTKRNWLIANFPLPGVEGFRQHVFAQLEKGWGRFRGQSARCWAEFGSRLFYGENGRVCEADVGAADNGSIITCDIQGPWSRFGTSRLKQFTQARLHLKCEGAPSPLVSMVLDFQARVPTASPTITEVAPGAEWDVSLWDVSSWGGVAKTYSPWVGIAGQAVTGALRMRYASATATISLVGYEVIFEPGGMM